VGMDALLGPLVALARASMARDKPTIRRMAIAALAGVLAGVLALASVACGLAALWIVVLPHLGPAWAILALAGILAVLCLALLALAFTLVRRDRRQPQIKVDAEASLLAVTRLFGEHKGAMLLAALVAGLNAGGASGGNRR
jgi:hypothetical protein